MLKTYHGSCHCQAVRFEVDLDLSLGTSKCNCRFCWKNRWWSTKAEPHHFRPLSGQSELIMEGAGQPGIHGNFCRHCGVRPYAVIPAAEWNEGERVAINVAALDDLDPAELLSAPVRYCDGRADNWWNAPAETRHL